MQDQAIIKSLGSTAKNEQVQDMALRAWGNELMGSLSIFGRLDLRNVLTGIPRVVRLMITIPRNDNDTKLALGWIVGERHQQGEMP